MRSRGRAGPAAAPARRDDPAPAGPAEPGYGAGRVARSLALGVVSAGLITLVAAACALSYPGLRALAGQSGVAPELQRIYPVLFDALLVIAGSCVLALRGAGLPSRLFAWLCLLALLAALAAASAAHAAGIAIPARPARMAAAVIPWPLVLIGLGLLLALLRHARLRRLTGASARSAGPVTDAGPQAPPGWHTGPVTGPVTGTAPAGPAAGGAGGDRPRPLAGPARLQLKASARIRPASGSGSEAGGPPGQILPLTPPPGPAPPIDPTAVIGGTHHAAGAAGDPGDAEAAEGSRGAGDGPAAQHDGAPAPPGAPAAADASPSGDGPVLRRPRSSPTPPDD